MNVLSNIYGKLPIRSEEILFHIWSSGFLLSEADRAF